MSLRHRRRRSLQKPKIQPELKRRQQKIQFNIRETAMKLLIALFLLVDVALVFFLFRACRERKPAATPEISRKAIQADTLVVSRSKTAEKPSVLQIEVLNGCGVPGIADRFTAHLRKNKFDVVRTGNYETFGVPKTVVIDRKGKLENAVRVAKALGLPKERAIQEQSEAYLVDATVILGSDFRQLSSWKKMEKQHARMGF